MESMAVAMAGIKAILYGGLTGVIAGGIVSILVQRKHINKLWVASGTTLIVFMGLLAVRTVWDLMERTSSTGLSLSLRGVFWGWFLPATLIVISTVQWLTWLMAQITKSWQVEGIDKNLDRGTASRNDG